MFHYRAGGDFAENGVPAERIGEIHTRYADAMLALILERGEPDLGRERRPPDRMVGCCRDATVLFLALARHKGIPARARVGFALGERGGLRVPRSVTSFDPGGGPPREVTLRT